MSDHDSSPILHVPARDIPVPAHLSPGAKAQLAMLIQAQAVQPAASFPPITDKTAWRALLAAMDQQGVARLEHIARGIAADVEEIDADGVRVVVATPRDLPANDKAVYLDMHGGALVAGGGASCRAMAAINAGMFGMKVWEIDYRLPPDHPYPAPLDDCVTAYRALLRAHSPQYIVIGGASAGGNLAPATILRARDEGLPLPACAVLLTPELDLTESGDSFHSLLGIDSALTGSLMAANLLYANGHDLTDPYLSPLFGDFTRGFPPTFLQSGTRDLFLSNAVRMHRALRGAGVVAELHVFEAATHMNFWGCPEGDDFNHELDQFLRRYVRRGSSWK